MSTTPASHDIRPAPVTTGRRIGRRAQAGLGLVLVLPGLALICVYFLWPLGRAFQVSLYDYTGLGRLETFTGLENYHRAITDAKLWLGLLRNVVFAAINIAASLLLGSVLAYELFKKIRGWRLLQVALFIPHILPVAVVALLWRFIYQPTLGLLDQTLSVIGVGSGTTLWLGEPLLATGAVAIAWAWTLIPFAMLIIFVGMLRIPPELMECARLDGATERQTLRHVVLPAIKPTLWLVAAIVLLASFRSFDLLYIMTEGGPGYATTTGALYMFQQAFEFNQYGYASAIGFVIAVLLGLVLPVAASRMRRTAVEL